MGPIGLRRSGDDHGGQRRSEIRRMRLEQKAKRRTRKKRTRAKRNRRTKRTRAIKRENGESSTKTSIIVGMGIDPFLSTVGTRYEKCSGGSRVGEE